MFIISYPRIVRRADYHFLQHNPQAYCLEHEWILSTRELQELEERTYPKQTLSGECQNSSTASRRQDLTERSVHRWQEPKRKAERDAKMR